MGKYRDKLIHQEVLFTKEECEYLLSEHSGWDKCVVISNQSGIMYISSRRNSSKAGPIPWSKKATDIILPKLNKLFGITSLPREGNWALRYNEGEYFTKHHDSGTGFFDRVLSISVQLTDENEYEGGELVLYPNKETIEETVVSNRTQGNIIAYKPEIWHEAKPVTKGTRYSLILFLRPENYETENTLI
jgi:predicted 2-oxoglutarate/Fe(II)-dependent dioxygenase YbiX